jgi:hypothetical protein
VPGFLAPGRVGQQPQQHLPGLLLVVCCRCELGQRACEPVAQVLPQQGRNGLGHVETVRAQRKIELPEERRMLTQPLPKRAHRECSRWTSK